MRNPVRLAARYHGRDATLSFGDGFVRCDSKLASVTVTCDHGFPHGRFDGANAFLATPREAAIPLIRRDTVGDRRGKTSDHTIASARLVGMIRSTLWAAEVRLPGYHSTPMRIDANDDGVSVFAPSNHVMALDRHRLETPTPNPTRLNPLAAKIAAGLFSNLPGPVSFGDRCLANEHAHVEAHNEPPPYGAVTLELFHDTLEHTKHWATCDSDDLKDAAEVATGEPLESSKGRRLVLRITPDDLFIGGDEPIACNFEEAREHVAHFDSTLLEPLIESLPEGTVRIRFSGPHNAHVFAVGSSTRIVMPLRIG